MSTFEAHGLSALDSLPPTTRYECGVCWRVYDPSEGDDYWQIPAGTSFASLPDFWTCPNCDTPREKFVALDLTTPDMDTRIEALIARYNKVSEDTMKDLPAFNKKLAVEAVGFRPFGHDYIGMIITPWFLNITILPGSPDSLKDSREGESLARALPSGEYDFLLARLEEVGPVLTCSLFSPMEQFASQDAAKETALAALAALFNKNLDDIEVGDEPLKAQAPSSRRTLLFGRNRGDAPNA